MAGNKVNTYSIGDSNIQSVMLTLDRAYKGMHQVSLTNYSTTAESQVAAGSVIEIGGGLYKFDSNETITGTPSDGTVYIMAVPSGDSVTCSYTNTAPTWSDSKQGWYGTGATVNNRYLEFVIIKTGAIWNFKHKLKRGNSPLYCAWSADYTATATTTVSYSDIIPSSKIDPYSILDISTGVLTIPKTGLYKIFINSSIFKTSGQGSGMVHLQTQTRFSKNGSSLGIFINNLSSLTFITGVVDVANRSEIFIEQFNQYDLLKLEFFSRYKDSSGNNFIGTLTNNASFLLEYLDVFE